MVPYITVCAILIILIIYYYKPNNTANKKITQKYNISKKIISQLPSKFVDIVTDPSGYNRIYTWNLSTNTIVSSEFEPYKFIVRLIKANNTELTSTQIFNINDVNLVSSQNLNETDFTLIYSKNQITSTTKIWDLIKQIIIQTADDLSGSYIEIFDVSKEPGIEILVAQSDIFMGGDNRNVIIWNLISNNISYRKADNTLIYTKTPFLKNFFTSSGSTKFYSSKCQNNSILNKLSLRSRTAEDNNIVTYSIWDMRCKDIVDGSESFPFTASTTNPGPQDSVEMYTYGVNNSPNTDIRIQLVSNDNAGYDQMIFNYYEYYYDFNEPNTYNSKYRYPRTIGFRKASSYNSSQRLFDVVNLNINNGTYTITRDVANYIPPSPSITRNCPNGIISGFLFSGVGSSRSDPNLYYTIVPLCSTPTIE